MRFEWDNNKNESNIKKHALDFHDARFVFEQPLVKRVDSRKNYGEERTIALGQLEGAVVVIVYALRIDVIRIISMRRANQHERQIYQKHVNQ